MVHYEQFGQHKDGMTLEQGLQQYDKELAAHYRGQGRVTNDDSWSAELVKKFSPQPREKLRSEVAHQGFDFR
jgi:hypothetical protein